MNKLDSVALEYNAFLNSVSNEIKKRENLLQSLNINIPFKMALNEESFLEWNKIEKCDKWRLLFIGSESKPKPFIATPINIRIKYYKCIDKFVEEFSEFIESHLKKLKEIK